MPANKQYYNPELWGGIECTINRVNNIFNDQLEHSGHYTRTGDLEAIADLGIKKIRYPVLWEKHMPSKDAIIDWSWTEQQLTTLKDKHIDVIAGLIHHGSGPAFTNLLDPEFPDLLAAYAKQVAVKFPWVKYYTPVNEPLTTARFSGLYGFWYPHVRDDKRFLIMLLNEIKGTVLAMKAIKEINPLAQLIQTEDLGKTYSTDKLQYQAKFENERRWLSYDLLCGKVTSSHKLWKYFKKFGLEKELEFFVENPCVPDVFGFNYYVTSERFLDDRTYLYPHHKPGGNKRHKYVDIEAVRVNIPAKTGPEVLLQEAWNRYKKPMAITEVHLHCTREEQLRWFKYMFNACQSLMNEGVEIQGITSWAMLGSFGWNKLLTEPGGEYEPGAFDVRGGKPRPTALAQYLKSIYKEDTTLNSLTRTSGWWKREERFLNLKVGRNKTINLPGEDAPLLIIGKNGTLGKAFARVCESRFINYKLLSREDCNIADLSSIEMAIERYRPWAIINAAGYVRVDDAEREFDKCFNDNTKGPENLAIAANKYGIRLVSFSSDLVFDGAKKAAYVESDPVSPVNVYGRTKAQSEELITSLFPAALIVRTSAFFSPWDPYNFVYYVRKSLLNGETISVINDITISPTYVPDLANTTLDLLIDGESGIWHLANDGEITWADLSYEIADRFNLDRAYIQSIKSEDMHFPAKRPLYSVLSSERGILLPTLESAIRRYVAEDFLFQSTNRKPKVA